MGERIEGRNAVLEALRAGRPLTRVRIARGAKVDRTVREIIDLASGAGVRVEYVERDEIDRASARGRHQGVDAFGPGFVYASLDDLVEAGHPTRSSLIVVLDHVTDPGNLGAVIRAAECAGARGVVIPERRSASVTEVVHKASAGATAHQRIARVPNIVQAIRALKGHDYWVVGASSRAPLTLWQARLEGRIALVLGAEGAGLSRLVEETCDLLVAIPVVGRIDSLNVSQAAAVLLYEWMRRGTEA